MHKEHHHDPQLSLDAGVEVSDMNVGIIYKFGIVLAITIISSVLIIIGMIRALNHRAPMNAAEASPLNQQLRTAPAGPQLQTDPVGDNRKILEDAARHLTEYGIVDENPQNTKANIPVDIAMDLIAEGKVAYRQKPFTARLDAPAPAPAATPGIEPGAGAPVPVPATGAPDTPASNINRPEPVAEQQQNVEAVAPPAQGGVSGSGTGQ